MILEGLKGVVQEIIMNTSHHLSNLGFLHCTGSTTHIERSYRVVQVDGATPMRAAP